MGKFTSMRASDSPRLQEADLKADAQWWSDYPAIHEYLTEATQEGGGHRQTATLLIFYEDGYWKVCLNDRQNGRSLWASAAGLLGALLALEEDLEAGGTGWRKSGGPSQSGKPKNGLDNAKRRSDK